jgi:hypothetical protein
LARKPNYGFEKRQKELERKTRKEAKAAERERRRSLGLPPEEDEEGLSSEGEASSGGLRINPLTGEALEDGESAPDA